MRQTYFKVGLILGLSIFLVGSASPKAATSAPARLLAGASGLASGFALEDFDGDQTVDFAEVQAERRDSRDTDYWIALHLSSGPSHDVRISAPPGGLALSTRDVNGDDFPDLVITTRWTNRPVAVLVNDGQGNFYRAPASLFPGAFANAIEHVRISCNEVRDCVSAILPRERSSLDRSLYAAFTPADCPTAGSSPETSPVVSSLTAGPILGRAPPAPAIS